MTEQQRANIRRNIDALKAKLAKGEGNEMSLTFAISEGEGLLREWDCQDCGSHECTDPECYKRHWA